VRVERGRHTTSTATDTATITIEVH